MTKLPVIILCAAVLLLGITQLGKLPLELYPEFDPPLVEVQTEALGLSSSEVEALITVPLEADLLNGVAWLDQIYSESVTGLSSILLLFDLGTDLIAARQMVQERLTQAYFLPNVSKPPMMLQPLSSTSRVMLIGLKSQDLSLLEMGVLTRWNIKPRLMGVKGVANVAVWGQRERQLQVLVDPKRLNSQGVRLSQVIETTGEALWSSPLSFLQSSTPGTAGWIDTPNQRLSIRHELPISTAQDLAKVSLIGKPGILLGNVADVVEDHQPLIGDAVFDDKPGLILVVEKFPWAQTMEVTQGVEDALQAIHPGLKGIEFDTTIFKPANYLALAGNNLIRIFAAGLLLVSLGLFLYYRNLRPVVAIITQVLLSLFLTLFILRSVFTSLDLVTLTGLAAALIIVLHEAIISFDQIIRAYPTAQKLNKDSIKKTVYSTLIIFLIILPSFFIKGLTGTFIAPLIISFVLVIALSFITGLFITPIFALTLSVKLPRHRKEIPPKTFALYNPKKVMVATSVVILATILWFPTLKMSLPVFKQKDLLLELTAAAGTSQNEMTRIISLLGRELKSLQGIKNVQAHFGRAITGDQIVGINSAKLWINLSDDANYEVTVKSIEELIQSYPGLMRKLTSYQPKRLAEALTSNDKQIIVRVYGYDFDVLQKLAQELQQNMTQIQGINNAKVKTLVKEPQVEIEVDMVAAQKFIIKPGDVRRQATTLLSGLQVGNLYQEQKIFDVIVWSKPEIRNSLTDIQNLLIETPVGLVPLSELARVRIAAAPVTIKRDIVSRFMDVTADISGRNVDSVIGNVESLFKSINFPLEYHAEVLKTNSASLQSKNILLAVMVIVLIGIFLLLQTALSSWRLAAAVTLSLPFVISGGVLLALLGGKTLSVGGVFGLLAILGIAVRNTLELIPSLQNQQKERNTPLLFATLLTGLILLPSLIIGPIAGNELLGSMAVIALGGLLTTIIYLLFVLPTLYLHK